MSMTIEETRAHERYQTAPKVFTDVVDNAYKAARKVIEDSGMDVANDDRAEALVSAIVRYIEDSAE
jgi:hypothetical protein